ncbi:hypothetical protein BDV26DRAFT_294439 [Aspergillus bertholletiae]|uniref:AMP-dependent synthetase/ligase domain-containing protein n=1 Tax=Aspergillus bertholletiae TaxID=1226010 RepID=A0A5N7B275_9EURO|nr:hypothetical protein BDV26DRAFT_294439 [Aspergillus bertholletiae]
MRQVLREQLPSAWFDENGLLQPDAPSIAFLAFNGYYFIVSFLAIAARGGIRVPLCKSEHSDYGRKANCILVDKGCSEMALAIKDFAQNAAGQQLTVHPVTRAEPNTAPKFETDEQLTSSPDTGCLVLFTSGTTSVPKGVFLSRRLFYSTQDPLDLDGLYLSTSSVHWIGGSTGLIDSVLYGQKLHIVKGDCGAAKRWELLKAGTITEMSVSPTALRELKDYDNENISCLAPEDRDEYINGARKLKVVYSSGSPLHPSTRQFFVDLTGMPFMNGYGITEMGGGVMIASADPEFWEGYIGTPMEGRTVKLSDGDHGEILVKHPRMFIKYMNDEAAPRAAFDEEGFYKPSDYAHRVEDNYFFDGRVSSDFAYKLPPLLRVLQDEEQVPLTTTGKQLKREALQKYFHISGYMPADYAVEGVEYWGNKIEMDASARAVDWGAFIIVFGWCYRCGYKS